MNRNTLSEWIRNGPRQDETLPGWIIGTCLWWRFWAFVYTFVAGAALVIVAHAHLPNYAILAAYAIGITVGSFALMISPKYTVTRNY